MDSPVTSPDLGPLASGDFLIRRRGLMFLCVFAISILTVTSSFANSSLIEECPKDGIRELPPEEIGRVIEQHGNSLTDSRQIPADLSFVYLAEMDLSGKVLRGANLFGARLGGATLRGTDFDRADLRCVDLTGADLSSASLHEARLHRAKLLSAKLTRANLGLAELDYADLSRADLSYANLTGASLRKTVLHRTIVEMATFWDVDLASALFQPSESPHVGRLGRIKNLHTVTLSESDPDYSGLAHLQKALQQAGLRDEERDLVSARERMRTRIYEKQFCENPIDNWWQGLAAASRTLLFAYPSDYGRNSVLPLLIIVLLWLLAIPVYWFALPTSRASFDRCRIFRHLRRSRVIRAGGLYRVPYISAPEDEYEPIIPSNWFSALTVAAGFSLLSAVRIGFRDLNFGDWINRIRRVDSDLIATGWTRSVAGIQSLISTYLLGLSVLTAFGRPFD